MNTHMHAHAHAHSTVLKGHESQKGREVTWEDLDRGKGRGNDVIIF